MIVLDAVHITEALEIIFEVVFLLLKSVIKFQTTVNCYRLLSYRLWEPVVVFFCIPMCVDIVLSREERAGRNNGRRREHEVSVERLVSVKWMSAVAIIDSLPRNSPKFLFLSKIFQSSRNASKKFEYRKNPSTVGFFFYLLELDIYENFLY